MTQVNPSGRSVTGLFIPSKMKMIGCRELFVEFPVDQEIAQRNIPPGEVLRINPDGKATLLIMIQEWERCILDGFFPIQGMKMSHIWIELEGPDEVGPALEGTQASLPTSYYYALPHQIDNPWAVLAFRSAGIDVQLVKRIEVNGNPGENLQLKVIEQENPAVGYTWEAGGDLWETPKILTGRRWFFRNYGRLIKRKSAGLVVCQSSFIGEASIQMNASPGCCIDQLGVGKELPGKLQYVTTDCNCVIRVGRG